MLETPRYLSFRPISALRDRVESIWIQEHPPAPAAAPTTVLPAARVELVLSYGDPFVRVEAGGDVPIPQASIVGQRTRPMAVRATGSTGLVIVCFWPWAAGTLLGADSGVVADDTIAVSDRFGDGRERMLRASVDDEMTAAERVARVQSVLLGSLTGPAVDPLGLESADRINRAWGREPVQRIADDLGISRRNLQRRVTAATGLGPKKLASVVRFQKALFCMRAGIPDTTVVSHCGYTDQSHLIHDVRAFAGRTPTELRAHLDRPLARNYNHGDVERFYNTVYLQEAAQSLTSAAAPRSVG